MTLREAEDKYGDFCLLLFFGVQQGDKIRGCIDPAEVSTLLALLDTAYMCGIDGFISMLQCVREHWGACSLLLSKEDWSSGFRRLKLLPS